MVSLGYVQSREHVEKRINKGLITKYGVCDRREKDPPPKFSAEEVAELNAMSYRNFVEFYREDIEKTIKDGCVTDHFTLGERRKLTEYGIAHNGLFTREFVEKHPELKMSDFGGQKLIIEYDAILDQFLASGKEEIIVETRVNCTYVRERMNKLIKDRHLMVRVFTKKGRAHLRLLGGMT